MSIKTVAKAQLRGNTLKRTLWTVAVFSVTSLALWTLQHHLQHQSNIKIQQRILKQHRTVLDHLMAADMVLSEQTHAPLIAELQTHPRSALPATLVHPLLQKWWSAVGQKTLQSSLWVEAGQVTVSMGQIPQNLLSRLAALPAQSLQCFDHACFFIQQTVIDEKRQTRLITLRSIAHLLNQFTSLTGTSYAVIRYGFNEDHTAIHEFYDRQITSQDMDWINQLSSRRTDTSYLQTEAGDILWNILPLNNLRQDAMLIVRDPNFAPQLKESRIDIFFVVLFIALAVMLTMLEFWLGRRMRKRLQFLTTLMPMMGQKQFQEVREKLKRLNLPYWSTDICKLQKSLSALTYTLESYEKAATQRNQEMERLSLFDSLTGLPNRALLQFEIEHDLREYQLGALQGVVAVMILDLDQFKRINDSLDHQIGDTILAIMAKRLKNTCQEYGLVARLGGDEFALLLRGCQDIDHIKSLANRVLSLVGQALQIHDTSLVITCSIGAALGTAKDSYTSLVKHAEIAMYKSKQGGGNRFTLFNHDMASEISDNLSLEGEIRRAFQHDQFMLYLQPKVNMAGSIKGFEALVRWQHPERGILPPADFIPAIESMGFIAQLDNWVLDKALQYIKGLSRNCSDITISVNISSTHFAQAGFFPFLRDALQQHSVNAHRLELEITETLLMENMSACQQVINKIKSLGVRIAIDDFGTGYSSLGYLKKLPVDTLKIDREFIRDIPDNVSDMQISSAIIFLAKQLHLTVVAEGVETHAQLAFLKQNNCDLAQGFLFSKPLPAEDALKLLQQERALWL